MLTKFRPLRDESNEPEDGSDRDEMDEAIEDSSLSPIPTKSGLLKEGILYFMLFAKIIQPSKATSTCRYCSLS